ncbi:MAG: hypothetical protein ACEPOW_14410 [Bacteroidales bacterium]
MIFSNSYPTSEEERVLFFRSEMNYKHFSALSYKLENSDIENEILNNEYYQNRISRSMNYSNIEVSQWLKNSWNTEHVLYQNLNIIQNTNQSFSMQWAFPQAYYAVFGNIMAMYKTIGYTETSHAAVLKKYSSLMAENKLPESISICCGGIEGDFSFHNIEPPVNILNHLELDFENPSTIDNLICQFLKSTRVLRLKEKAPKMNFRTQNGGRRKRLNQEHWERVSNSIGATSIIDFLYRKRIKGNYQDIEIYNTPYFKGEAVINCLLHIVDRINLVNESYIAKSIGLDEFRLMVEHHLSRVNNEALSLRFEIVRMLYEVNS